MKLLAEGLKQLCAADKTAACLIETRSNEIAGALQLYIQEIERFNSAYGLVKTEDRNTLIVKHIFDSLAPVGHIARFLGFEANALPGKTLADIGSGAGLPGIPLAICLPKVKVSLIERMGRRAGFLRNTAAVLNSAFPNLQLSRITVEEIELEKTSPRQYDCIVLRALSPLDNGFAAKLCRLLKQGGVIAAYKGRHDTARKELGSLADHKIELKTDRKIDLKTELIPLAVPFLDEERCLAVIR